MSDETHTVLWGICEDLDQISKVEDNQIASFVRSYQMGMRRVVMVMEEPEDDD